MKEKGVLILNSEWDDRGYYAGSVVTSDSRHIQQIFFVDVAPTADVDLNSGSGCKYDHVIGFNTLQC